MLETTRSKKLAASFKARFGTAANGTQCFERAGKFVLVHKGQECVLPHRRSIFDRTSVQSFFPKNGETLKQQRLREKREQTEALHRERLEDFIDRGRLREFDPDLSYSWVQGARDIQYALVHTRKGEVKIGRDAYFNVGRARGQGLTARDIQCLFFARLRYKSNAPLRYTDREWAAVVREASSALVIPAEPFKPFSLQDRIGHNKFKCTQCQLVFTRTAAQIQNMKHLLIRCPDCQFSTQPRNASLQSGRWLEDLESRFGLKIKRAGSGGERRIDLATNEFTYVDGWHAKSKTVFEFHGSRWHGNPLLFYPWEQPSPYSKATAKELLLKTLDREERLHLLGYQVIRIWDQDFLDEKRYQQWLLTHSLKLRAISQLSKA